MELKELPQIVGQTIEAMAEKLKVPAEKILDVAIQGVRIEGIAQISVCLLIIISTIYFAQKVEKHAEKDPGVRLVYLIFLVWVIPSIVTFYEGIIKAFAPAYWIIKQILNI